MIVVVEADSFCIFDEKSEACFFGINISLDQSKVYVFGVDDFKFEVEGNGNC